MNNKYRNDFKSADSGQGFVMAIFMPFLVALVFIILCTIIAAVAGVPYNDFLENTVVKYLNLLISGVAFFLAAFFIIRFRKINFVAALGVKKKLSVETVLLLVLLSFVLIFCFAPIVSVFDHIIALMGYTARADLGIPLKNGTDLALALVFVAALPALCEELLFRGVILNGLKSWGKWPAILTSALCFMLIHGSLSQTFYTFFLGVVLGYIAWVTRSIWAPIIVHFVNNAIVIVMAYLKTPADIINVSFVLLSLVFMALGGVMVVIICRLLAEAKKRQKEQELEAVSGVKTLSPSEGEEAVSLQPVKNGQVEGEVSLQPLNSGQVSLNKVGKPAILFKDKQSYIYFAVGFAVAGFLWFFDLFSNILG